MEDNFRPYLIAALLCEKVLQEADGSLSVIRIADRVQLQMQGPPGLTVAPPAIPIFQLNCLIALKSGPLIGDYTLRLTFKSPTGNVKGAPVEHPLKFLGKDHGQNLIVQLVISAEEEGLHWVHVELNEIELTRIPLTVVRTAIQPGPK